VRWLGIILVVVTTGAMAWLGLSSPSFDLDTTSREVSCRSVLAPITNASLTGGDEVPDEVIEEWLIEVGYEDDLGVLPADIHRAADERARELCTEARANRLGWMVVAGGLGTGLAATAGLLMRPGARSRTEEAA
jgi:hypothetical protein